MTKIALIRGDFANPWELQNFKEIPKKCNITVFTGKFPISNVDNLGLKTVKLFSPVDFNIGKISTTLMGGLNRAFVDAHILFGLEEKLKGFDIAHCAETYYGFTQQCIEAKRRGYIRKIVSTVWENIPFNNEGIIGRKENKIKALDKIDMFLPVTEQAKNTLLQEGCKPNKIVVLKPGLDLATFYRHDLNSFKDLKKNKKIKLLFVGRLEPEKGIDWFTEQFISLRREDLELIIVGEGSLKNKIREIIHNRTIGNVHLLSTIEYREMPLIYSICDIYIHPVIGSKTWSEQYGMVLLEAMSCGLPVVAINNGAIAEIVSNCGLVVERTAYLDSVLKVCDSRILQNKFSKLAIKNVKENYDSLKFTSKLLKFYEKVLNS